MKLSRPDLRFEQRALDSLGRILISDRDFENAAEACKELSPRASELPALFAKHKVPTIAAENLRLVVENLEGTRQAEAKELLRGVRPIAEAALRHRALVEAEAAALGTLVTAQGLGQNDVTILKGLCNARHYPSNYSRWMRDLDIFVPSWESAAALLEGLLDLGFEYDDNEHPWLKSDLANGRSAYGQIFLIRPIGDDFSRIDIHFGTYSVGFLGYLQVPLADNPDVITVQGAELQVANAESALLVAQAHALSDGYVSAKDVSDFVAVSINARVDWEHLGRTIREHNLEPQADVLASHVLDLYDDDGVREAAERFRSTLTSSARTFWQLHNRDWALRARVNAIFTFHWSRSHSSGSLQALWSALQCYAFYIRRLELCVRRRTLRERVLKAMLPVSEIRTWRLRPDACMLLIDSMVLPSTPYDGSLAATVTPVDADGIEAISVDGIDLVQIRGRIYVPTFDLIVEPASAGAAIALAGQR